ncbi:MAG: TetR/AcrR family transcriptional regulator, partial [Planctomycetota bacterium]
APSPRLPAQRPGPRGGKRDRNRRERTAALLDAALTLFLERGVEGVSIEAIAGAAGLAKGSFYRYFQGKPELVAALVAPVREELRAALERARAALAVAEAPLAVLAAYADLAAAVEATLRAHPRLARLYLQEARAPATPARRPLAALSEFVAASAIELTREAQARGLLRPVPATVSALAVVGAAERLLEAWLAGQLDGAGEGVAAALVEIALCGLQPEPPAEAP